MFDTNVPQPWQGRATLVFVLAVVAAGLGNTFRLPFLIGEFGGGPFIAVYFSALLVIVAPILVAEVAIGSFGRSSPVGSLRWTGDQSGAPVQWSVLGWFQSGLGCLVAMSLWVMIPWLVDFGVTIESGRLASASAQQVASHFIELVEAEIDPVIPLWAVCAAATVLLASGPKVSITLIGWLVLPVLCVALFSLVDFALVMGDLRALNDYVFVRRSSALDFEGAMIAIGCALTTAGAGLGVGLTVGGRTPSKLTLARSVLAALVLDSALMMTMVIIVVSVMAAVNSVPVEGISLVFVAIPHAFVNLPVGDLYGAILMLVMALSLFAASVVLLEPAVVILTRELNVHRFAAAAVIGFFAASGAYFLGLWGPDKLSEIDALMAQFLIPVSMCFLAFFAAWQVSRPLLRGELYREPGWLFEMWWLSLRFVAPAMLLVWLWWSLLS